MALQNFVDGQTPLIGATWLNKIDAFYTTLFNSAITAAQALTALGATSVGTALFQAATAAAARAAITAAASGANTDITSLSSPALAAATATTQTGTDSSTKVATTAFVAGQFTGSAPTQTANKVFAGPASGGAAAPTFRSLVTADFPGVITLGTPTTTTSGTTAPYTSIPSTAKRITVSFANFGFASGDAVIIQIGSGSFSASGYLSVGGSVNPTSTVAAGTTGFRLVGTAPGSGTPRYSGSVILTLQDSTNNVWAATGNLADSASPNSHPSAGSKSLAAGNTLDRVQVTSAGGATFAAGTVNITYE